MDSSTPFLGYLRASDSAVTPIPDHYQLSYTEQAATYMRRRWRAEVRHRLGLPLPHVPEPEALRPQLREELSSIAVDMAEAFFMPVRLEWDVGSYSSAVGGQSGDNKEAEERLRRAFPPLNNIKISAPATATDVKGNIVAWFLPSVLSHSRSEAILQDAANLRPVFLHNGPKNPWPSKKDTQWRINKQYYHPEESCRILARGLATLSPGYHELGHSKFGDRITPSRDLAGKGTSEIITSASREWLRRNVDLAAIMSGMQAIAQPDAYALTRESLLRLADYQPEVEPYLPGWGFTFNAVSLIANRSSPIHRDTKSGRPLYSDALMTVGGDSTTVLEMPGLGIRMRYSSGSAAIFSGHSHLHGVSFSGTDRLCIAAYSRPTVHMATRVHSVSWATVQSLLDYAHSNEE